MPIVYGTVRRKTSPVGLAPFFLDPVRLGNRTYQARECG